MQKNYEDRRLALRPPAEFQNTDGPTRDATATTARDRDAASLPDVITVEPRGMVSVGVSAAVKLLKPLLDAEESVLRRRLAEMRTGELMKIETAIDYKLGRSGLKPEEITRHRELKLLIRAEIQDRDIVEELLAGRRSAEPPNLNIDPDPFNAEGLTKMSLRKRGDHFSPFAIEEVERLRYERPELFDGAHGRLREIAEELQRSIRDHFGVSDDQLPDSYRTILRWARLSR